MKRVTVSIPGEIDARVRQWAEKEDKSLSQVYAEPIEAHLRENRRQKAAQRVASIFGRTTARGRRRASPRAGGL
jgi:predicted transcriptional regulator